MTTGRSTGATRDITAITPVRAAALPAGVLAWFAATVSLVFTGTLLSSRYLVTDSYYDLYVGRYLSQHGIPRTNVVTVASHGAPWIDQQWLAHLLYYGAWLTGGYPAVAVTSAALVTAGFAGLAGVMLWRGVPAHRAFAWTVAAFAVCEGNLVIRAQSIAYPLFALTLWLILADGRAARPPARTWLVIPVLTVWANTHGSALLGAGLAGLYAGSRAAGALRRRDSRAFTAYLGLGTAAGLTLICTPYGFGAIHYYTSLIGNPELARNIEEWAPPSLRYPFSWAFFALLGAALVALALGWRRGGRPDPLLLVLAAVLLAGALTAVRNQAWFGYGGSLLAADTLARSRAGAPQAVPARAFRTVLSGFLGAAALTMLAAVAVAPAWQFESQIPRRAVDAAAVLAARHPGLRILGDQWSATPLLWLHPATLGRVGYDWRLEQYTRSQLAAYFDFLYVRGPRWQRVMRGYGIVVVTRRQMPRLATALTRLPGWRVAFENRGGLVLIRSRDTGRAGSHRAGSHRAAGGAAGPSPPSPAQALVPTHWGP